MTDAQYQDPKLEGWMRDCELQWLFRQAQKMDSIIEIGSWMGKSTHALLSGCKGIVHAVDTFKGSAFETEGAHKIAQTEDICAKFLANVGHFPNLQLHKMLSLDAAKLFEDRSFDMVWLDASHDYDSVKADLLAWQHKCRMLLCGHDIWQSGVSRALKELGIPYQVEESAPSAIWSVRL